MHEYDTVLKSLLTDSRNTLFERITGARRGRWLNVELPKVAQPRVDLLFRTTKTAVAASRLLAMELQSINDLWLPVRMAEYSLAIYRAHGQFPEQYVLYVGRERMRMPSELASPNHICRYKIVDIRDLDAEIFLNSPFPADIVLAILARYSDKMEVIGRILSRIAKLEKPAASVAFAKLGILAGLRQLEDTVKTEAQQMPILNDIMDHKIIGPAIRQGMEEGLEKGMKKGMEKGMEKGRREGALDILRGQIADRFGSLSAATEKRLAKLSTAELENVASRILHATSLTDLFGR